MDVLCSDKTGTLTEGVMKVEGALDAEGDPSGEVFRWAFLNSLFQSGLTNPLDEAVLAASAAEGISAEGYEKLDEIPYDFVRKRLSVLVASPDGGRFLVTKGALRNVLDACTSVNRGGASAALDDAARSEILERFASWSTEGYRVIGVARKAVEDAGKRQDESDLEFLGFLRFSDPPSEGVSKELEELRSLGVRLKLMRDNRYVSPRRRIGGDEAAGSSPAGTGGLRDEALGTSWSTSTSSPSHSNQKERMRPGPAEMGSVVGFLGDGINDARRYAADVGISVDKAVDVARRRLTSS